MNGEVNDYWSDNDYWNDSDYPKWLEEEFMGKELKFKQSDKKFLSPHPDQNGNIVWGVYYESYENGEESLDCDLQIGDCSGWINIEFSIYRHQREGKDFIPAVNKRIKKLDNLINSLLKLRKALEECKRIKKEA